jgi:hypothetical protein
MRWWLMLIACPLLGHDIITTRITWAREISRIVHHRCASCHRPGSTTAPMSLLTYDDARPWARAIAEEVLERRMPPWNPVKGFGQFKHEAGLNQEEIGLIADWVEGGAPLGEERYLPPNPAPQPQPKPPSGTRFQITDQLVLSKPLAAQGIAIIRMPESEAVRVWAESSDGATEPLLEIASFRSVANQPYEFARTLSLPAGTKLHVEGEATVSLISSAASPARQRAPSAPGPTAAPAARRGARPAAER